MEYGFSRDAVIITGAGSGIGAATAMLASRTGLAVAIWELNSDAGDEVRESIRSTGGRAETIRVDVTRPEEVARAHQETEDLLGGARYLVNNAGPSSFSDMGFTAAVDLALGSVQSVTTSWLGHKASADGTVVNVASVAGAITGAGASDWYAAAKAGIAGLTRYLAVQRPNGIRANAVAPGVVATDRTREMLSTEYGQDLVARNPMGRPADPADVAAAIVFLLSPAAGYINGVLLPVDGGAIATL